MKTTVPARTGIFMKPVGENLSILYNSDSQNYVRDFQEALSVSFKQFKIKKGPYQFLHTSSTCTVFMSAQYS